jgi:hypothetical protein
MSTVDVSREVPRGASGVKSQLQERRRRDEQAVRDVREVWIRVYAYRYEMMSPVVRR